MDIRQCPLFLLFGLPPLRPGYAGPPPLKGRLLAFREKVTEEFSIRWYSFINRKGY